MDRSEWPSDDGWSQREHETSERCRAWQEATMLESHWMTPYVPIAQTSPRK